ncbi:chymotrypsin-1-like [Sitodiplosis mosellana]|uniref:chymotrypsin-1-like n=1 Tax=Sitodiplosis mosellana TaxID=263140 RepID=UPI00244532E4|nr:chymotrypsin-1-like [Sitodiplosis mosellana]
MKVKLLIVLCILKLTSCDLEYSQKVDDSLFIVGGSPAYDGQAPYQCSMQKIRYGSHFCGCAIISDRWVVTAAHCLGKPVNGIEIRVGSNKKNSGGQVLRVEKTIRHPKYSKHGNPVNDIGLVNVQGNIKFNDKVKPINYGGSEPSPGTELLATGWGMTPYASPEDLQQLKVTAISLEECQSTWSGIDASVLCTSSPNGQGMCKGDSGSPLVNENILVGLVSFGEPCAKGRPDAFANVAHFRNWIKSTAV